MARHLPKDGRSRSEWCQHLYSPRSIQPVPHDAGFRPLPRAAAHVRCRIPCGSVHRPPAGTLHQRGDDSGGPRSMGDQSDRRRAEDERYWCPGKLGVVCSWYNRSGLLLV